MEEETKDIEIKPDYLRASIELEVTDQEFEEEIVNDKKIEIANLLGVNEDEIGEKRLASLARIGSITDTWTDMAAVDAAKKRLAEARSNEQGTGGKEHRDFTFVVNDSKTYYTLTSFKNPQAQQKAKVWIETQKEYDAKGKELSTLRSKYASMNEVQRTQIAAQIRLTESAFERLATDKLALEKEIRRLELNN